MSNPETKERSTPAEEISESTRLAVITVISSGKGSLEDAPQEEVLAVLRKIACAKGLEIRLKEETADETEQGKTKLEASVEESEEEKRELSPEQAEAVLKILKQRSDAEENKNLCPGLDWEKAKETLEKTPEALWSVNEMEESGHKPTIYFTDDTGFDIGTLSAERPENTKNCVYDKEAEQYSKENHPDDIFNGNAEAQAEAMGIDIMTVEQGRYIIENTPANNEQGWRWYKTPDETRNTGRALRGFRCGSILCVCQCSARNHFGNGGWGGSLRVNY